MSPEPSWPRDLGSATLRDALGVKDLHDLKPDPAQVQVARDLVKSAHRLDHVHNQLVQLAASASQDLQRIAEGADDPLTATHGALGSTALSIELLAARRAELLRQLPSLIDAYRRLAAATAPGADATADRRSAARPTASRATLIRLSDAQKTALVAIGRGEARIYESLRGSKRTVICSGPEHILPATVHTLAKHKLVLWDTGTSLYTGQRLSLTPAGERLRAAILDKQNQPAKAQAPTAEGPPAARRPGSGPRR